MKKRNGKLISMILAMVMMLMCFALSASALDYTYFEYDDNGNQAVKGEHINTAEYQYTIVDTQNKEVALEKIHNPELDATGTLVYPAEIDGYNVKYVDYACVPHGVLKQAKKIVVSEGIETLIDIKDLGSPFNYLESLEEVVLPSTFTDISQEFFAGCTNLKKIILGDNIRSIGDNAFLGCDALEEVVLPKSLETIGDRVFWHCDNIKSITIDPSNKNFVTKNNVLFGLDENGIRISLIYYAPLKETTKYKIPSTVKTIENGAFRAAKNLENLTITKQVTSIGEVAFAHCDNLKKIKIYSDSKLKTIGESAFSNCKKLKSINIPQKVEFLGYDMFDYCDEKIKITIRNPELVIGCEIPREATLIGYENSTAEKYVKKYGKAKVRHKVWNNIKFNSLGTGEKVFNIRVKDRARTYLSLKWEKIDGADKYQIYVSTNGTKWKKAGESKTNSFRLSDRKASTWYYIKVRAIKDGEKCKFSSVYKTATKPKTPQNVEVKLTKKGNIKVNWDKLSKVAGYRIYYSTDKNFKKNVEFVYSDGGNPDSFTFNVKDKDRYNFKSGKTYYFRVVAYKVQVAMDYDIYYYEQEYIESSPSQTVSIKLK